MDWEEQKKKWVLGDSYGLVMSMPMGSSKDQPEPESEVDLDKEEIRLRLPDIGAAIRRVVGRREAGEFVSGALAGAMTKAVLAPLETIRTRMVVGVGSKHIGASFAEIIQESGWRGLWAGNAINMLRIIPTQAVELATFEAVQRAILDRQQKQRKQRKQRKQQNLEIIIPWNWSWNWNWDWVSPVAVGGATAGVVSTLLCHPLEVLKDRLTINRDAYPSLPAALTKIYRDDGLRGFYAGLSPTIIGMLPYSTCYYFMYHSIKASYCTANNKKSLNRSELLLIGALSGLSSFLLFSFPL